MVKQAHTFRTMYLLGVWTVVLWVFGLPFLKAWDDSWPILPNSLPKVDLFNQSLGKYIPQKLWIAVKSKEDALPGHLTEFFNRNKDWEVNICDNKCKDDFMSTVFGNTKVYWAYSMINPLVGAAKADIWRYSALYTYGGVYLDDDSDIKTPLDEVNLRFHHH